MSKAQLTARLLDVTGLGRVTRALGGWSGLLVLAYHRVGDSSTCAFDRGVWSVSPEDFDAQVEFLKKHFDVIAADDLPDVWHGGRGRHVLLTFDDGYRDNFDVALPILSAHGATAVFFLTSGFLDRTVVSWWDELAWMVRRSTRGRLPPSEWLDGKPLAFDEPGREVAIATLIRVYKRLASADHAARFLDFVADATACGRVDPRALSDLYITWDMAREMRDAGMFIGGHTVTHPILSTLPRERQESEIAGCTKRIREELGLPMRWFSYPVGHSHMFDAHTRDILAGLGVEFAFTCHGGYSRPRGSDRYAVPRYGVGPTDTASRYRAMFTLPQLFCGAQ